MTENQFWFGDTRLLQVYQCAYRRNCSYNAWLQGNYVFEAISKAIHNGFGRKKKSDKAEEYSKWIDPMSKYIKPKIIIEDIEEEFRKQQIEQQAWLFHK